MKKTYILLIALILLITIPLIIIKLNSNDIQFDKLLFINNYSKISISAFIGFLFGIITNIFRKEYELYKMKRLTIRKYKAILAEYSINIKRLFPVKSGQIDSEDIYDLNILLSENESSLLSIINSDSFNFLEKTKDSEFINKIIVKQGKGIRKKNDLVAFYKSLYEIILP